MAPPFDLEEFVGDFEEEPSKAKVDALRFVDLLRLCRHFALSLTKNPRKAELREAVLTYYVTLELLNEEELAEFDVGLPTAQAVQLETMRTEAKIELARIELSKEQVRVEVARLEHEAALAKARIEPTGDRFNPSQAVRLVPVFQDRDIDRWFQAFEKVAIFAGWPKDKWVLVLQACLQGKAQIAYAALSLDDSNDYDLVKAAVLRKYSLVPEAYRQKFRGLKRNEGQSYAEFATGYEMLFDRWCVSAKAEGSFDKLRQMVLMEQFRNSVPTEISIHLGEREVETVKQAGVKADEYALNHRMTGSHVKGWARKKSGGAEGSQPSGEYTRGDDSNAQASMLGSRDAGLRYTPDRRGDQPTLNCWYCKGVGHPYFRCERWEAAGRPSLKPLSASVGHVVRVTPGRDNLVSDRGRSDAGKVRGDPLADEYCGQMDDRVGAGYAPFMSKGEVSFEGSEAVAIDILRDTGAQQSLLLEGVLPQTLQRNVQGTVIVEGVEGGLSLPLVEVNLKSLLVTGAVKVGITPRLPVKGVGLLLGNDLAGGKVVPCPHMSSVPYKVSEKVGKLEQDHPGPFPACAVTRAQASKADHSLRKVSRDDVSDGSRDRVTQDKPLENLSLTTEQLIVAQKEDETLQGLWDKVIPEEEAVRSQQCYFLQNGVLMRQWRPPDAPLPESWRVQQQIVVPLRYRDSILSLAHDTPMAGHLGVRKTYERLLRHFFWPGVKRAVVKHCRTCHVCQTVGKPNQHPPRAPLRPVPAFEEPFKRVIVDCVGPLPRTSAGKEYMLTIMCASTRFPEAIPLRTINAPTVCEALKGFFARFGLPMTVQSDQGSNFQSKRFKSFLSELGITHATSSAYHPESQGALERFHQTLKTMIRAYCAEHKKDWDTGIPYVLFATGGSVQESLGFSPYELVFGHTVRGPLIVVKDQWLNKEGGGNVMNYVASMREKLGSAVAAA